MINEYSEAVINRAIEMYNEIYNTRIEYNFIRIPVWGVIVTYGELTEAGRELFSDMVEHEKN